MGVRTIQYKEVLPFSLIFPPSETKDSECTVGKHVATDHSHSDTNAYKFLRKIKRGVFILGIEVGFLVQGSTIPTQAVAVGCFAPTLRGRLAFSLGMSYLVAALALGIFFTCQKMLTAFFREIHARGSPVESNSNVVQQPIIPTSRIKDTTAGSNEHHSPDPHASSLWKLEEWEVDVQCDFMQGAVVGVFLSWMCCDLILNFSTQVIYGSTIFLVALLIFGVQVWWKAKRLDDGYYYHCPSQNSTSAEGLDDSNAGGKGRIVSHCHDV